MIRLQMYDYFSTYNHFDPLLYTIVEKFFLDIRIVLIMCYI